MGAVGEIGLPGIKTIKKTSEITTGQNGVRMGARGSKNDGKRGGFFSFVLRWLFCINKTVCVVHAGRLARYHSASMVEPRYLV